MGGSKGTPLGHMYRKGVFSWFHICEWCGRGNEMRCRARVGNSLVYRNLDSPYIEACFLGELILHFSIPNFLPCM